jgi:hypothetical protein
MNRAGRRDRQTTNNRRPGSNGGQRTGDRGGGPPNAGGRSRCTAAAWNFFNRRPSKWATGCQRRLTIPSGLPVTWFRWRRDAEPAIDVRLLTAAYLGRTLSHGRSSKRDRSNPVRPTSAIDALDGPMCRNWSTPCSPTRSCDRWCGWLRTSSRTGGWWSEPRGCETGTLSHVGSLHTLHWNESPTPILLSAHEQQKGC